MNVYLATDIPPTQQHNRKRCHSSHGQPVYGSGGFNTNGHLEGKYQTFNVSEKMSHLVHLSLAWKMGTRHHTLISLCLIFSPPCSATAAAEIPYRAVNLPEIILRCAGLSQDDCEPFAP